MTAVGGGPSKPAADVRPNPSPTRPSLKRNRSTFESIIIGFAPDAEISQPRASVSGIASGNDGLRQRDKTSEHSYPKPMKRYRAPTPVPLEPKPSDGATWWQRFMASTNRKLFGD